MRSTLYKFSLFRDGETGCIPGHEAVGEGCVFSSDKVAIAWLTPGFGIAFYESLEDALKTACADRKTRAVLADLDFTHA
jgi:hypothetical protein